MNNQLSVIIDSIMSLETKYDDNFDHELRTPISAGAGALYTTLPDSGISPHSQSWRSQSYCDTNGQIAHLFFAPAGEREPSRQHREALARAVCNSCVVMPECRAYARENNEYGFWGGESEDERALATGVTRGGMNTLRNNRLKNKNPAAD